MNECMNTRKQMLFSVAINEDVDKDVRLDVDMLRGDGVIRELWRNGELN
jgi:hypothetical protein